MGYCFDFRLYHRPFRSPLRTHHGYWNHRQGIIVRLEAPSGRVGFGEIAPLDWFGSESLAEAIAYCQQLPTTLAVETIFSIPDALPACQFGFESAWEQTQPSHHTAITFPCSALLPTGVAALQNWQPFWHQGVRTFKWKIGVAPMAQELEWFAQLTQQLPVEAALRLDANGGLTRDEACQWLTLCADRPQVEFLEQPLPPNQFEALLDLATHYSTPIALDESISTISQLQTCYQQGWRGIVVIKAAIAGSPKKLRHFCQHYDLDVVWSSVFETAIAYQFITRCLIPAVPQHGRAIGFGVTHWFADVLNQLDNEHVWNHLGSINNND